MGYFATIFVMQLVLFGAGILFFPPDAVPDWFSWMFVGINACFVSFYLFRTSHRHFSALIFVAFVLRIFLLVVDYYEFFPLFFSGGDTEVFHSRALANQTEPVGQKLTNYTDVLTVVYRLTDSSRIIAQYINVLLGTGVLLILRNIVNRFEPERGVKTFVMMAACFMPVMMINSAVLLREAWIEFFVIASACYFIRWYETGHMKYAALTAATTLGAMYMHSGMIALLFIYSLAFISYRPKIQSMSLGPATVIRLVVFGLMFVALLGFGETFMGKFNRFGSSEDVLTAVSTANRAGSAYLQWMNGMPVPVRLVLSPLKMFYFLFSPLPVDWRMPGDALVFAADSSLYAVVLFMIWRNIVKTKRWLRPPLVRYLLWAFVTAVFLFSYGTANSGTAVRHRAKLMPVLLVTLVVSSSVRHERKNL